MATRKYNATTHAQWSGGANPVNFATGEFRWYLVDSAIVPADTSVGGHEFVSDIRSGVISETGNLSGKSFTDRVFDADDVSLPDDGGGQTGEYLVLAQWTGSDATSRVVECSDDAANLPITQDGVADEIQHNVSGILRVG